MLVSVASRLGKMVYCNIPTMTTEQLVPPLANRLRLALDLRRKTIADLRRDLEEVGVPTSKPYLYTLWKGTGTKPSYLVIAGLAKALQVDLRWFFEVVENEALDAGPLLETLRHDRPGTR